MIASQKEGTGLNTEHIGVLIARLRKEKGMTQQELAQQLGITDKAVSKWERCLSCPDISILPQVAEILGVTVDDLLSTPKSAPRSCWKEFDRSDIKEMISLVCRCVSLALSVGGLVIFSMGKLAVSDLCVMLGVAVALLALDSLNR